MANSTSKFALNLELIALWHYCFPCHWSVKTMIENDQGNFQAFDHLCFNLLLIITKRVEILSSNRCTQ